MRARCPRADEIAMPDSEIPQDGATPDARQPLRRSARRLARIAGPFCRAAGPRGAITAAVRGIARRRLPAGRAESAYRSS